MAPIEVSVDVDRPQQEALDYVTDPARFHEWQTGVVVGGSMEGSGHPDGGAKCSTTRT